MLVDAHRAEKQRHQPVRVPTPYPLPTDLFVETLVGLQQSLPKADRATVGLPGMIRHGVVVTTPHYVTKSGPRTRVLPELVEQWDGFDAKAALDEAFGIPTRVLNDAEVHGAGVFDAAHGALAGGKGQGWLGHSGQWGAGRGSACGSTAA